jgi:hypothetical protein
MTPNGKSKEKTMKGQDTSGHEVEILACECGKSLGVPCALLVVRPHPEGEIYEEPISLLFNQEQCIRLRDALNGFLCRERSWLYLPRKDQKEFSNTLKEFAKRSGGTP